MHFQCKVKGVKNAGDKKGLNIKNVLYFSKGIPNINVPLKYRCVFQHEILKVIYDVRLKIP